MSSSFWVNWGKLLPKENPCELDAPECVPQSALSSVDLVWFSLCGQCCLSWCRWASNKQCSGLSVLALSKGETTLAWWWEWWLPDACAKDTSKNTAARTKTPCKQMIFVERFIQSPQNSTPVIQLYIHPFKDNYQLFFKEIARTIPTLLMPHNRQTATNRISYRNLNSWK